MLEWCCNPGSLIARYSRRIPRTKAVRLGLYNIDLADAVQVAKLRRMGSQYLESNGALRVFVSIPCTCWCKMQSLNVHQHGKAFEDRLQRERQGSQHMMRLFLSTYHQWKRKSPTKVLRIRVRLAGVRLGASPTKVLRIRVQLAGVRLEDN